MAETDNKLTLITRAHRQHTSVVTTIPKAVRDFLQIKAGEYLLFTVDEAKGVCEFSKFHKAKNGKIQGTGNSDR